MAVHAMMAPASGPHTRLTTHNTSPRTSRSGGGLGDGGPSAGAASTRLTTIPSPPQVSSSYVIPKASPMPSVMEVPPGPPLPPFRAAQDDPGGFGERGLEVQGEGGAEFPPPARQVSPPPVSATPV